MATRVICDHCGNTISDKKPRKYALLRAPYVTYVQQYAVGGLAGAAGASYGASTPSVNAPIWEVELCIRCDEIWVNRVKNLTATTGEENDVQS